MDVQKLIGHNVTHKSFGTGRILSVNDTQVIVDFDVKGIKKLQFPQTFAKYMRIDDEYLHSEIMALELSSFLKIFIMFWVVGAALHP